MPLWLHSNTCVQGLNHTVMQSLEPHFKVLTLLYLWHGVFQVCDVAAIRITSSHTRLSLPKVLTCSQFLADATYPLPVTVTVAAQGEWEVSLSHDNRFDTVQLRVGRGHPLSAFAGCPISRMHLSQDRKLTITLASSPAAAAAAASPSRNAGAAAVGVDWGGDGVAAAATAARRAHADLQATPAAAQARDGELLPAPIPPPASAAVTAPVGRLAGPQHTSHCMRRRRWPAPVIAAPQAWGW